jgi:hypothetical protein
LTVARPAGPGGGRRGHITRRIPESPAAARIGYSADGIVGGAANHPANHLAKRPADVTVVRLPEYSPRTFGGIPTPPANGLVNGSRQCPVLG